MVSRVYRGCKTVVKSDTQEDTRVATRRNLIFSDIRLLLIKYDMRSIILLAQVSTEVSTEV